MKFKIEITCDNAAFREAGAGYEVGRILENLGTRMLNDDVHTFSLYDSNGNKVGEARWVSGGGK